MEVRARGVPGRYFFKKLFIYSNLPRPNRHTTQRHAELAFAGMRSSPDKPP